MDGLAHLLSTGQGVVLTRSPYSDIIFLEALYRHNLITKTSYKGLLEIRNASLYELLKPHLVIYLDVPVATTHVSSLYYLYQNEQLAQNFVFLIWKKGTNQDP